MNSFGSALKSARKSMGWDQRSLGSALRMSDKTIKHLEEEKERPDTPAAAAVLELMKVYGIKFNPDFSQVLSVPAPQQRFFLTLDFRFEEDKDERVRSITRRMHVVGMPVVRRLNQARNTLSSNFDGVEIHVPRINVGVFAEVLTEFIKDHGPSIDCMVRNERGLRLTVDRVKTLWN